jgi:hypothetical protein
MEGRTGVTGEITDKREYEIGNQRVVGWCSDVVKRPAVPTLGHQDARGIKTDAPRRDPEVPAEPVEPSILGVEEQLPGPLFPSVRCDNSNLPDG